MTVLRNTNPIGQADLPLIGRQGEPLGEPGTGCLEPGEEFQCSTEHARLLLAQTGNYEPVDAEAKQIAEQLAAEQVQAQREGPSESTAEQPDPGTGEAAPAGSDPTAADGEVR